MRELVAVWGSTRAIVQVAMIAALYAAVLIPFKAIGIIIPGITEVRPANAIPIVCSLLFGPAAAWGSAFGNLIGDAVGATFGPGSIFGFIGNFLYGYLPYRIWGVHRLAPRDAKLPPLSGGGVGEFVLVTAAASLVCGGIIAWGAELLTVAPFKLLSVVIPVNNFVMAAVLGPPLLLALYPRVRAWGLLHWQIPGAEPVRRSLRVTAGALLCWAGAIAIPVIGFTIPAEQAAEMEIVRQVAPALGVMLVGLLLV
jgi:energy-coupling factor transport system substrate-specific component